MSHLKIAWNTPTYLGHVSCKIQRCAANFCESKVKSKKWNANGHYHFIIVGYHTDLSSIYRLYSS